MFSYVLHQVQSIELFPLVLKICVRHSNKNRFKQIDKFGLHFDLHIAVFWNYYEKYVSLGKVDFEQNFTVAINFSNEH